jgi:hypothetical protein
MRLEITDTRSLKKGVRWAYLGAGVIYIDYKGAYVMATDESSVVDLSDGVLHTFETYRNEVDEFIPTKCKLEVFA